MPLVDEVIALDLRNREIKQEVEALRAEKNKVSKLIGACMAQGKRDEAEEYKKQVNNDMVNHIANELLMKKLLNFLHENNEIK